MAADVVADGGLDRVGHHVDLGEDVLDRAVGPLGAVERLVRVVDVGLVVLVVVDLHRLRVDVRLEGGEVVGKGGSSKGISVSLSVGSLAILSNVGWVAMRVVLGCGNFGGIGSAPAFFGQGETKEQAFELMDAAWELGLRRFDTADAYGGGRSEQWIGDWLRATGNRPRVTTKTFNAMEEGADCGLGRDRVLRQVETSLERLGVEQIDLYLTHAPDPDTPVEETYATFATLVERGAIGAWGVSNVGVDDLREWLGSARRRSSRTRTRCSTAATRRS